MGVINLVAEDDFGNVVVLECARRNALIQRTLHEQERTNTNNSEAVRKLSMAIEHLSSRLLAVMQHGVAPWSEPVQQQMYVTYWDHRRTRC